MRTIRCVALLTGLASVAGAQEMPADYRQVLDTLSRQGDYKAGVLKVNVPRNDLDVSIDGIETPAAFGFGGWVALARGDGGMDVMMGDLVLLQEEVGPVMSALLDNGLDVTALHNHFFWDEPRVFFLHVHGHGTTADLARRVKPALALIGRTPAPAAAAAPIPPPGGPTGVAALDTARIAAIVGRAGEPNGAVYKVTVGRDDLHISELGAPIGARMGLNSWAAFIGTAENAAVAGDIAMLGVEVEPVLRTLRQAGIEVVALHNHMIGTEPPIYFLHYWGEGRADLLAGAFRDALAQLGRAGTPR
ncbi:MAG: DUF1259 domain-containing protein [Acidobacteria bacterium]|nr:DUF1259 domain-containing protein [Acidobacteriota bacterium]